MIKFTTVDQASEALDALQFFVRKLTEFVRNGDITIVGAGDNINLIDFALNFEKLDILRFENDGGYLTVVLDLDDEEFIEYTVKNSEVQELFIK